MAFRMKDFQHMLTMTVAQIENFPKLSRKKIFSHAKTQVNIDN